MNEAQKEFVRLVDEYAESRSRNGYYKYNAKTAKAREAVISAMSAVGEITPTATAEMIAAAEEVEDLYRRGTPETWGKVWRAMWCAAPSPDATPTLTATQEMVDELITVTHATDDPMQGLRAVLARFESHSPKVTGYPPLPDSTCDVVDADYGEVTAMDSKNTSRGSRLYTAEQMQSYIDADRAARNDKVGQA